MKERTLTIRVDMNKKCKKCGKPGATQNDLCIKCTGKLIAKSLKGGNQPPVQGENNGQIN